jgi:nucleoside-diphosphate-sugar epimerase
MRILVTGGAGLVGVETLSQLCDLAGARVVGTSRARSADGTDLVAWDMAHEPAPSALHEPWDVIVHTAADTRWTLEASAATRANVATLAALAPLTTPETHLIHVSTAYATGRRGSIASHHLSDYRNTYEWSKAHAERLAAALFPRLTIVRPPLIMGRRDDGRAARFAGLYTLLRGLTTSMVPAVVASPDAYFEVIPVDDLAALLVALATGRQRAGATLTIAGGEHALSVQDAVELLTDALNAWREDRGFEPIPAPRLVSSESWNRFFLPFIRHELTPRQLHVLELLSNFQPYLAVGEPLDPTHPIDDIAGAIPASVRHWADVHERQASLPPRPWNAAA